MASTSSSSISIQTTGWTYDVFLSFRGEDTRNNFVDHLFAALVQKGIKTFKDDEILGGGQPISEELLKAIKESRFSVVVFSKNYAKSSWCLEELSMIMECHDQMRSQKKVLPVFYHVDPSDVRGQKRDFVTAFETHEDRFKGEMEKVNKWRSALTAVASLSGYHISTVSGGEYAIIDKIVQEILHNIQPLGNEICIIGIESHMEILNSLLIMEATQNVRIIGILGMGGIGKTTIARALFRRISYKFQGSCFVKDVRQNSSSDNDICALQKKVLKDILGVDQGFSILDPEDGAGMIKERFYNKKVLLVLDDVHDMKQLEFLAATHEWFGPGSRIVITTRDRHILADANDIYKPPLLRKDQATELFSRHAFRKNSPPDGYLELSDRAINYTGRLPLALKVLGSFFRGREARVWGSALDRLAKIPSSEIYEKLKLSFDDLDPYEQKIFLDIACFYKGEKLEDVTRILDSFGFDPVIGISVLIEKSLITVSKEELGMHDLIQEMGWQIVRESAPNSRLWKRDQILGVIHKSRELDAIEAIVEPFSGRRTGFNADIFRSMKNLRLLHVDLQFTSEAPTFFPDELRWLHWEQYPYSSLPDMCKLVGLDMILSKIEHLWNGQQSMLNLKFINLKGCKLARFPDVSGAPNIERLILAKCNRLVDVHESLGYLKRLVYLDMSYCNHLKCLPSRIEMDSLETLLLIECTSLERIPKFSPCMVKLSYMNLQYCRRIEELPSSIKYLSNLSFLNLQYCYSLKNIPNSLGKLKCLKCLCLNECSKLLKLPDELGHIEKLEELHIRRAKSFIFRNLPALSFLRKLVLSDNKIRDEDFPKNLQGFSALEELHLDENGELMELPSITNLSNLRYLDLTGCRRLQKFHGLPVGIQILKADDCVSLEKINDLSEDHKYLYKISLVGCHKLIKDEMNERYLANMLRKSVLQRCAAVGHCLSISIPGRKIPSWFNQQEDGGKIALHLPPGWQTQTMGFAICGSSSGGFYQQISFRFEDGETFLKDWYEKDDQNDNKHCDHLWISFVPFSLIQNKKLDHNDFEHEDWSLVTEGNLVIKVSPKNIARPVRCGAHVVYKEDLESTQQSKSPSISSSTSSSPPYWNWEIINRFRNSLMCIEPEPKPKDGIKWPK
uniref:TMV resistance protein N-like n=1 Tax=Erigeron canadensis TaxID=72917 RepID=UPI001CB8F180|nr:TMV resistance protein N-like [Erigeron canadensis]